MAAGGMAVPSGHTNWSQASSVGIRMTMSSRNVIACDIMPHSLLLNMPLSRSSQQSLVQVAVSSTPVSSQNVLTSGETPTSCAFPFGHCHHRPCAASPTLCKAQEYASNHRELSQHLLPCHKLSYVEGHQSRWANVPPLDLNTPLSNGKEALG